MFGVDRDLIVLAYVRGERTALPHHSLRHRPQLHPLHPCRQFPSFRPFLPAASGPGANRTIAAARGPASASRTAIGAGRGPTGAGGDRSTDSGSSTKRRARFLATERQAGKSSSTSCHSWRTWCRPSRLGYRRLRPWLHRSQMGRRPPAGRQLHSPGDVNYIAPLLSGVVVVG